MNDKFNYNKTLEFYKNRDKELNEYIRLPNLKQSEKTLLVNEGLNLRSIICQIEYTLNENKEKQE